MDFHASYTCAEYHFFYFAGHILIVVFFLSNRKACFCKRKINPIKQSLSDIVADYGEGKRRTAKWLTRRKYLLIEGKPVSNWEKCSRKSTRIKMYWCWEFHVEALLWRMKLQGCYTENYLL